MAIDYPVVLPADPGAQILLPVADDFDVVTEGFDGSQQVQSFPGERWQFEADYPPMTRDEAEQLIAVFAACRKRGTFLFGPERGSVPRGSALGKPYVVGASGSTLDVRGWTPSQAAALKAGDWLQISQNLLPSARDFTTWDVHDITVAAGAGAVLPGGVNPSTRLTPTTAVAFMTSTAAFSIALPGRTFYFDVWLKSTGASFTVLLQIQNQSAVARVSQAVTVTSAWARFRVSVTMSSGDTSVIAVIGDSAGSWQASGASMDINVASVCSPNGPDNSLLKAAFAAASDGNGLSSVEVYPAPHAAPADGSMIFTTGAKGVFRLTDSVSWSESATEYGLKVKMMEAY